MYRPWLVVLSVLAGCDAVFGLDDPGRDAGLVDPDGGTADGDALDGGGPPAGCRVDDFSGALPPEWSRYFTCMSSGCSVTTSGGQLVLSHDGTGYVGVYRPILNFTASSMAIEAGAWNTITTEHQVYVSLSTSQNNEYQIILDANGGQPALSFETVTNGVSDAMSIPFNATLHRWWQIEHIDTAPSGKIVFSTRASATALWEPQRSVPVTHPVTALIPEIGAGSYASVPTTSLEPTVFTFDNVTLCPAP